MNVNYLWKWIEKLYGTELLEICGRLYVQNFPFIDVCYRLAYIFAIFEKIYHLIGDYNSPKIHSLIIVFNNI